MLAALAPVLSIVLAITPHAMRAHIHFLASDTLEGREAGTRGYDVAAVAADESGQKLDYDSGARWARVNLDVAVAVANANERPRWNDGDFFGTRFTARSR